MLYPFQAIKSKERTQPKLKAPFTLSLTVNMESNNIDREPTYETIVQQMIDEQDKYVYSFAGPYVDVKQSPSTNEKCGLMRSQAMTCDISSVDDAPFNDPASVDGESRTHYFIDHETSSERPDTKCPYLAQQSPRKMYYLPSGGITDEACAIISDEKGERCGLMRRAVKPDDLYDLCPHSSIRQGASSGVDIDSEYLPLPIRLDEPVSRDEKMHARFAVTHEKLAPEDTDSPMSAKSELVWATMQRVGYNSEDCLSESLDYGTFKDRGRFQLSDEKKELAPPQTDSGAVKRRCYLYNYNEKFESRDKKELAPLQTSPSNGPSKPPSRNARRAAERANKKAERVFARLLREHVSKAAPETTHTVD